MKSPQQPSFECRWFGLRRALAILEREARRVAVRRCAAHRHGKGVSRDVKPAPGWQSIARRHKRQYPGPFGPGYCVYKGPGDDLLLHGLSHTTIGAAVFHFRVRDGIGWYHSAVVTRERVEGRLLVWKSAQGCAGSCAGMRTTSSATLSRGGRRVNEHLR